MTDALQVIGPLDDPTLLWLTVDMLPPDLRTAESFLAPQPAGLVPGATVVGPQGAAPAAPGAVPPTTGPFWWQGAPPVQGDNLLNGSYSSAVAGPLQVILAGTASTRIHLYSVLARTTPAGASTLTILDGSLPLIPAGMITVGAALTQVVWPIGLTIRENNSCTINLTAAGAGNSILLLIQADRF